MNVFHDVDMIVIAKIEFRKSYYFEVVSLIKYETIVLFILSIKIDKRLSILIFDSEGLDNGYYIGDSSYDFFYSSYHLYDSSYLPILVVITYFLMV